MKKSELKTLIKNIIIEEGKYPEEFAIVLIGEDLEEFDIPTHATGKTIADFKNRPYKAEDAYLHFHNKAEAEAEAKKQQSKSKVEGDYEFIVLRIKDLGNGLATYTKQ
jgi:hypothetical protein